MPASKLIGKSLIVDSSAKNRQVLINLFTHWGSKDIDEANTADTAIANISLAEDSKVPYDFVITSASMQRDGAPLAEYLVNTHGSRVIHLADDKDLPIAEHPLLHCLNKPISQVQLYQCIKGVSELKSSQAPSPSSGDAHTDMAESEDWHFNGAKLLVIDDNETNRALAAEILTMAGCQCDCREDGLQALEAVQAKKYDVVLMDIQMPVMDGLTAARAIRALGGEYTDLPIIAMTAHALTRDREKSFAAGMNAHVTKPIDTDILFSTLAQWIKVSSEAPAKLNQQSESAEQEPIPDLPGFDLHASLERVRGNWKLLKKLLIDFGRIHQDAFATLSQYLSDNDLEKAKVLTHTIKGSGANMGAMALSAAAAAIESSCKKNHRDEAIEYLETFKDVFTQVMTSIGTLVAITDENDVATEEFQDSNTVDNGAIYSELTQIQKYLNTDLGMAQDGLKSLKQLCSKSMYLEKVTKLEVAFQNFDMTLVSDEISQWLVDISQI